MNERREEIRREDKKWSWKFALIIVGSAILGEFIGVGTGRLMDWIGESGESLSFAVSVAVPVVAAVLLALVVLGDLIALPILWSGSKKLEQAAADEDEQAQEKLDGKLTAILSVTSISLCVTMTLTGVAVSGFLPILERLDNWALAGAVTFGAVFGLLIELALVVIFQRLVVNFYKEQNPEKQGSIYQVNFNKVWLQSCDEAEKLYIYRAGYKAYRVGHYTCLILWIPAVMGAMTGLLSWATVLFVGIVWTALQIAYLVAAGKKPGSSAHIM